MSRTDQDVYEALDRLAGVADRHPAGDRMPDIQRRVRAARRRAAAGIAAATVLAVAGGVGVWQALPATEDRAPDVMQRPTEKADPDIVEPLPVADRRRADLDGDSRMDTLLVRSDKGSDAAELEVRWGSGEVVGASFKLDAASLLEPVDLDGEGALEVLVSGGGGEYAEVVVWVVDQAMVTRVRSEDAAGRARPLTTDADPAAWQVHADSSRIVSYRLVDPETLDFPAPVRVRDWTLEGDALVEGRESRPACVTFQPRFVLAPC